LLTAAWLDASDRRDLGGEGVGADADGSTLRRLATALEVHALLVPGVASNTVQACAFVAAEALEIAREGAELSNEETPFNYSERLEAGLLYLIAGYDSNAAVAVRGLVHPGDLRTAERNAREAGLALVRLAEPGVTDRRRSDRGFPLTDRVRDALWSRLDEVIRDHLRWLRRPATPSPDAVERLRALADALTNREGVSASAQHPDIHHLALLLALAADSTFARALREVPPPDGDGGRFATFTALRCEKRPLLWPAAAEYAGGALPGPSKHAVVAVPTGAGKSSVAELAVAQSVRDGWVLYLAPTNALVGQVRRQLDEVIGKLEGVEVREFLGGAEYTTMSGETLEEIGDREVLVMTPEKCSLALRQSPEAFSALSLCVVDEAHQLGQRDARAIVAELVVSEVLYRSPGVRVLLMSALLANPDELASWLTEATNLDTAVIREPWRPTRTLRAVAGIDEPRAHDAAEPIV